MTIKPPAMQKAWFVKIIALVFVALFLYTGIGELSNDSPFQNHLAAFGFSGILLLIAAILIHKQPGPRYGKAKRGIVSVLPIVFLFIAAGGCRQPGNSSIITGLEGERLPSFNLLLADSSGFLNTAAIKGPAVLFYFTPDCEFCRKQAREIGRHIGEMKNAKVFITSRSSIRRIRGFVKEFELAGYDNVIAGKDTAGFVSRYFEITGVPFTAVYDADLRLKGSFSGYVEVSEITKLLSQLQ